MLYYLRKFILRRINVIMEKWKNTLLRIYRHDFFALSLLVTSVVLSVVLYFSTAADAKTFTEMGRRQPQLFLAWGISMACMALANMPRLYHALRAKPVFNWICLGLLLLGTGAVIGNCLTLSWDEPEHTIHMICGFTFSISFGLTLILALILACRVSIPYRIAAGVFFLCIVATAATYFSLQDAEALGQFMIMLSAQILLLFLNFTETFRKANKAFRAPQETNAANS